MSSYARGKNEMKAALIAIISIITFLGMYLWLTGRGISRYRSDLYVRTYSAELVKKGDPALYRGVQVGEVRGIDFNMQGDIVLLVRLKKPVPLRKDAQADLTARDVFGSQSVVLHVGSKDQPKLESGDTIPGSPAASLATRMDALGKRAVDLLSDSTVMLTKEALAALGEASRELAKLSARTESILAREEKNIHATATHTANVLSRVDGIMGRVDEMMDQGALTNSLDNLETASITLKRVAARMDSTSIAVAGTVQEVTEGEGTAGRMIKDPALYEHLIRTSESLDSLLIDIRKHPKRYFKVSVF